MTATTKKVLRRCAIAALLVFVTLIGILFFIRQRTIGEWRDFKAHWEAQGEHFDVGHFIPDPVPDGENLAMHPVFKDLWIEGSESALRIGSIDVDTIEGCNKGELLIHYQRASQNDLSTWNGLEADLSEEQRATGILRRMGPMSHELDRIAQALRERSECQFPVNWEVLLQSESPHIFAFLQIREAFMLRAHLHLRTGRPDLAIADAAAIKGLAAASGREDAITALLVEVAHYHSILTCTWDGVTRQAFSDRQLAELDSMLPAPGDLAGRSMQSMRFERAALLQVIDLLENDPAKISPGSSPPKGGFLDLWWDSNRLGVSRDLQDHLLAPGGTPAAQPTLANADRFDQAFEKRAAKPLSRYTQAIALMTTPAYGSWVQRILQVEAEINNTRVAIAVERHRLKHGRYPPDLASLVPEFLPALPIDEINSRPIEYRLRPDGTPLIYQWGGDGDDDGGTARRSLMHGDVVWQYPLDPPLTRKEYRRED